jgi:hypothetical protein
MKIETAFHAYRTTRAKRHGAGQGSHLLALKMALCAFHIANGCFVWYARFAYWLAIYGTPRLPRARR